MDTTQANDYYKTSLEYYYAFQLDSAEFFLDFAHRLYVKHLGDTNLKNAKVLHLKGLISYFNQEYYNAIEHTQKSIDIKKKLYGDIHNSLAISYNSMGNIYSELGDYDKAFRLIYLINTICDQFKFMCITIRLKRLSKIVFLKIDLFKR